MPAASPPIRWSPVALRDLDGIWNYLAAEASPAVAESQLREIERAVGILRDWPMSGRVRDELRVGVRSLAAPPYVVFYRVTKNRSGGCACSPRPHGHRRHLRQLAPTSASPVRANSRSGHGRRPSILPSRPARNAPPRRGGRARR